MKTLKELTLLYFDAFRDADLVSLKSFFAEEVRLQDWSKDAHGIESVIAEYSNIFEALQNIIIDILNLYEDNRTVVVELVISAKGELPIKVVDILTFNEDQKISFIRAYKR